MWTRFNKLSPLGTLLLLALPLIAPSCSAAKPVGKLANPGPLNTENPGYFDIGAGYGVVAGGGANTSGYIFSVKAYPAGRWYSNVLSVGEEAKNNISDILSRQEDEAMQNLQGVDGADGDGQQAAQKTLADVRNEIALWDKSSSWSGNVVAMCDSDWTNRVSVFYGHSLSDFEGGGASGSYKCVGLGYDIAPEFAVQFGLGAFDPVGGGELDFQTFVGISLNLNAFKSLVNGASL
jgi:hypothetical protein